MDWETVRVIDVLRVLGPLSLIMLIAMIIEWTFEPFGRFDAWFKRILKEQLLKEDPNGELNGNLLLASVAVFLLGAALAIHADSLYGPRVCSIYCAVVFAASSIYMLALQPAHVREYRHRFWAMSAIFALTALVALVPVIKVVF